MVIDISAARTARGLPAFHNDAPVADPVAASVKPAIPDDLRDVCRDATIARIRAALKKRTGFAWSVTGGRGTAWGWIRVTGRNARLVNGSLTDADRKLLADVLGFTNDGRYVGRDGWSIPASSDYYRDAIMRAETGASCFDPKPYWD